MRTDEWPQRERFVAHLDDLRARAGLATDSALADAAGISHTTISNWRRGKQRPELTTLQKVADALGVAAHTLAELAGIVDPARFGQAAPPPTPTVDELSEEIKLVLDDPDLSENDRLAIAEMLLEEFDRDEQERKRQQVDRARTMIETWKRARSA